MNGIPFFCALGAYLLWGFMPLYFQLVLSVPPGEVLAHRIFWSALLLSVLASFTGRWPEVIRWLKTPRLFLLASLSTLLIAANWIIYIIATLNREVLQASLGYYITPLFSVLLGLFVLGERLRPWQWVSLGFAATGVILQAHLLGTIPKLGLGLMLTFGLYGLVRKKMGIDSLAGLTLETLILFPFAGGFLGFWWTQGEGVFARGETNLFWSLVLSGPVTAAPLLLFGVGAKGLPLSLLGFLQYLSPSVQMLVATLLLGEELNRERLTSFALIWLGLAIFTVEAWHQTSRPREISRPEEAEPLPSVESP